MGRWHSGQLEISLVEDRGEVLVEGGGSEELGGWHILSFSTVTDTEAVAGGTRNVVAALEFHCRKNLQREERRSR